MMPVSYAVNFKGSFLVANSR